MSTFSKMTEQHEMPKQWEYKFKNLCELVGEAKDTINSPTECMKMCTTDTKMNDKYMPKLIDELPYNFNKCVKVISRGHDELPPSVKNIDILKYFTSLLTQQSKGQQGKYLWSSFFRSERGIPERFIETICCRLNLERPGESYEHEFHRYILLYSIITFYYNNLKHLKMYIEVIYNSLSFESFIIM